MPETMPGLVVTAKVRWANEPQAVGTQLFFFAPTVAAHAMPCILEEANFLDDPKAAKEDQVVKLKILITKPIAVKTEFKLQLSPFQSLADGIIQEVT